MKRKIFSLLLLALAVCIISSCTLERSYDGATRITPAENAKIHTNMGDTVVRLYYGFLPIMMVTEGKTMEEMVKTPEEYFETYYMIVSKDQQVRFDFSGDNFAFRQYEYWEELYPYVLFPERLFPSSVKVEAVYCIDCASACQDYYIYYVTDQGDYVFYTRSYKPEAQYLFPLSAYLDVAKIMEEYRIEKVTQGALGYGEILWMEVEKMCDIEQYQINVK